MHCIERTVSLKLCREGWRSISVRSVEPNIYSAAVVRVRTPWVKMLFGFHKGGSFTMSLGESTASPPRPTPPPSLQQKSSGMLRRCESGGTFDATTSTLFSCPFPTFISRAMYYIYLRYFTFRFSLIWPTHHVPLEYNGVLRRVFFFSVKSFGEYFLVTLKNFSSRSMHRALTELWQRLTLLATLNLSGFILLLRNIIDNIILL